MLFSLAAKQALIRLYAFSNFTWTAASLALGAAGRYMTAAFSRQRAGFEGI
ncbi:MAG TPA: hypothetical protein VNR11_09385 [Xanthobacteraceae bacterium]|nr:hypothetical protein [Xanthobacteraceae bacterium]